MKVSQLSLLVKMRVAKHLSLAACLTFFSHMTVAERKCALSLVARWLCRHVASRNLQTCHRVCEEHVSYEARLSLIFDDFLRVWEELTCVNPGKRLDEMIGNQ